MFRVWGKIFKDTKMIQDTTICISDYSMTRTHKVYKALEDMCIEFNLSQPIWLDKNKNEFIQFHFTRFYADNFIDSIDFDYLEFRVIEEDY